MLTRAQGVETVIEQYKAALADMEALHAEVEQIDTFLSGDFWHHRGEVTMLRKPEDRLFGFHFRAVKGVGGVALYDGVSDFQINHKKQTYELTANPQSWILGSPGGQLVLPELMNYQDPNTTPELLEHGDYYVLRYSYPDLEEYDVQKREKTIFLDKTTFLPRKVIKRQESLGKAQVITRIIASLEINREEDANGFRKDFLSSYKMIVEEEDEDLHAPLLQTTVQDFQLETFTGEQISTRPKEAKLLLLDFWDVWCGPCVHSMPKVQELAEEYGPQGLQVVGVLMDPNSRDSAERLTNKKGITFTQAIGSDALRSFFRVLAIPQYVLIDQEGTIQHIYRGYGKGIEKDIKALLAKSR
jgi:thiol-disulfide isomerase/thioredoxin